MANNFNQNFPGYVESDLNKAKIKKPPRIRRKEIDLYFYETNKEISLVESTDSALSIQARFLETKKTQITTPLNFDIAKPKFASISDTGIWGTQLNGFIYDDIDLDVSKYNFVTFGVIQQSNIKQTIKYRIVNINKEYDINNKFIYASITIVADSVKTIPSLEKFNWQLVSVLQKDTKIKYIKLELDPKTILLANGFRLSIAPEKSLRPVNEGYTINSINTELVTKLIKIRQTNPIEIDDITLSDFNERTIDLPVGGFTNKKGYLYGSSFNGGVYSFYTGVVNIDSIQITQPPSAGTLGAPRSFIVNQVDYFSKGLKFIQDNGSLKTATLKENNLPILSVTQFLNGTFSIDSQLVEKSNQITIEPALKKIEDLDVNNKNDKLYFALTKQSNLNKYVEFSGEVLIAKKPFPKTRLISDGEWGINFIDKNQTIVIEFELQTAGYNPKIELSSIMGNNLKLTQYDENHRIVGIPELNFQTEYTYDESQLTTSIQL